MQIIKESFPVCFTVRDLRLRHWAGQGTESGRVDFFPTLLPLVQGAASLLVPLQPEAAERITVAVLQAFALRWRGLSNRTLLSAWLLRSTWMAARFECRRLGLPAPAPGSPQATYPLLLRQLNGLPDPLRQALILRHVQGEPATTASRVLRRSEARVEKARRRGLKKLGKILAKRKIAESPDALLEAMTCPLEGETEQRILQQIALGTAPGKKSELMLGILRGWRGVKIRRWLKGIFKALLVILGVLTLLGFTFVWLMEHGYLTAFFLTHESRQMAKKYPEMLTPARPWPMTSTDQTLVAPPDPRDSATFFGMSNLWTARLVFTAEQWKKMKPGHVEPVSNLFGKDGKMVLRNPKAKRSGLAGAVGYDFNWTEAKLEIAGQTFPQVAARYRGNGTYLNSLFGPKQSLKVDLNKVVKGQNLAGLHTLNFVNSIPDNSYLHDVLGQQVFRDLGVPAPRTAYAYVTVDAPGTFTNQAFGLYVMVENLDSDYTLNRFGSKKVPLYKPVTYDLFKDLGPDWKAYEAIYDLKTSATDAQKERIMAFARLVTHADDAEFARQVGHFLDLEVYAGFVAGHVLLSSYDGYLFNGQNYFFYQDPRSEKFGFISWDQDHGWGEFGYVGTAESREQASIWNPSKYDNRFLARVMKVPAFREIYRKKLEHGLAHSFSVERLYPQIDHLARVIRPAVAAESDFRLKRFDTALSATWLTGPRDAAGNGSKEGPGAPVHQIKRFITNRVQSVRQQLDAKTEGKPIRE